MPSSERKRLACLPAARGLRAAAFACVWAVAAVAAVAGERAARADEPAAGFGSERLYTSAPGAGWFVLDDLGMYGGLGGVLAVSGGYAHDAFRAPADASGARLAVVRDQSFADFGVAVTYARFRLSANLSGPLVVAGESGVLGATQYDAPSLAAGNDIVSDVRFGFDARVLGEAAAPFRLGLGAQFFVPSGERSDYVSDGTYRAMGRVAVAGDVGHLTYAAHVGVHVRPRDDASEGAPRGSELLFAGGLGSKLALSPRWRTVIGPEVFGETAFRAPFGRAQTGLEGLLSARVEGVGADGPQLRFKAGLGVGFVPEFGTPEWRFILSVEAFNHRVDRDRDGVYNHQDGCPDTPGPRVEGAPTNGCPQAPGDAPPKTYAPKPDAPKTDEPKKTEPIKSVAPNEAAPEPSAPKSGARKADSPKAEAPMKNGPDTESDPPTDEGR